jgi:hypothetical protein
MLETPVERPSEWVGIFGFNVDARDLPGRFNAVEEPDHDDERDADWADDWYEEEVSEWNARPAFDPGWRGRAIASAALGAAVLARRAFAAWEAGHGFSAEQCQILAALALLGTPAAEA